MIIIVVLTALLGILTDAQNSVIRDNLPIEPMIIQLGGDEVGYGNSNRVQYKGCHKFCVGTVTGRPRAGNVWNPYNQSTGEVYLFRYVQVNMTGCTFPVPPQILELFLYTVDDNDYNNGWNNYKISRPADNVTPNYFFFLVYTPYIDTREYFTVRWTAYQNACNTSDTNAPIGPHFELDAFDPEKYLPVFQDD